MQYDTDVDRTFYLLKLEYQNLFGIIACLSGWTTFLNRGMENGID